VYGDKGDMSYTLESKGIGEGNAEDGSPWAIQITTINYWESVSGTITNPGEAHYYKFTGFNADNFKGWDLDLNIAQGEAYLDIAYGAIPGNQGGGTNIETPEGRTQKKAGDEHYYNFPSSGYLNFEDNSEGSGNRDWIRSGDYYVAVISEGQSPKSSSYLGTGPVSYTLASKEVEVNSVKETLDLPISWTNQSLVHGELQLYSFDIGGDWVPLMNVRLKNITGTPSMSMTVLSEENLAEFTLNHFPRSAGGNYKMLEGGYNGVHRSASYEQLINWVKPKASTYYILVQATEGDVSYDVEVTWEEPQTLSFANGQVSGTLIDTQRSFYTVEVPGRNKW
jgi:hypothetical protein